MTDAEKTANQRSSWIGLLSWLLVMLSPPSAHAGPWVPEPGEVYAKLSASYFSGTGVIDRRGNLQQPDYSYSHRSLRAYTEVGVLPHTSLIVSAPFKSARNSRGTRDFIHRGFGNLTAAAKIGADISGCAFAGQLQLKIPLYPERLEAGADATGATRGADAADRFTPSLGDGSYDATLAPSFGCAIPTIRGWASAHAGPTFRSHGFGTSLTYAATVGSFIVPDRLGIKLRAGGVQRFDDGNRRPTTSYLRLSGGPLVRLAGPVYFEAVVAYIPAGAFVSRGWSISAGISFDGRLFANPFE